MTAPGPGAPVDRFVTGDVRSSVVPWNPTEPAPLDQRPYLEYLERVDTGQPTGVRRLRELHPNPPCHTGGLGPLSWCPRCEHHIVLRPRSTA